MSLAFALAAGSIPCHGQAVANSSKESDTVQMSVFEVATEKDRGYASSQTLIGSRTSTPVKDIPQTVSILTSELLADLASDTLNDALRYMAGVEEDGQLGRQDGRFTIRGFQNAVPSKNGIKGSNPGNNNAVMDTHNVERIEVLKGPASLLYGSTSPGGLINAVPKRPKGKAHAIFKFTTNNYNLLKPEIDINRPLNKSGTVLGRFIGTTSTEDDFRNDVHFERLSLFPVVSWRITDRTQLTLSAEYNERDMTPPGNLIDNRQGTGYIPDLPHTFNASGPLNIRDQWTLDTTYDLTHRFNDAWSLRHALKREKNDFYRSFTVPGIINADLLTVNGQSNDVHLNSISWVTQNDVSGDFKIGTTRHKILFGGEYSLHDELDVRYRANTTPTNYRILANPGRGPAAPVWPTRAVYPATPRINRGVDDTSYGMYLNDSMYLFQERIIVVGGVRHDRVEQGSINHLAANARWVFEQHKATTPRYGVVVKANEAISVYAGYSESFVPLGGANPDGERYLPETGEGTEAGIMVNFLGGRLSSRVAVASIDQVNLLEPDPDPVRASQGYSVQTRSVSSDTVELEVTASLIDNWSLIGSFTHMDTDIAGAAPNSARLWNRYDFKSGFLKGTSVGAGWIYVDDRNRNPVNTPYFLLPSYNRFDGLIAYRGQIGKHAFKAQLNMNNVLQKTYVSNNRVPGNPETEYRFSMEFTF